MRSFAISTRSSMPCVAGTNPVALLGWATGGMWSAYYASLHPEKVGHLITLNALCGGDRLLAEIVSFLAGD
jgi:pimeloyl-ACP methyl ester carboxylesterase